MSRMVGSEKQLTCPKGRLRVPSKEKHQDMVPVTWQFVAVKRLKPAAERNTDFRREVEVLSRLNHPNIIKLIGFCPAVLVCEYMPLRSLHDWLHARQDGEEVLDWRTRLKIGAGVAKGLSYLHHELTPRLSLGTLKAMTIASLCMQKSPLERPDMRAVVRGMKSLAAEPAAEWPVEFNLDTFSTPACFPIKEY